MNYQFNNQSLNRNSMEPPNEKLFWFAFLGAIFIYSIVAVIISQTGEGFEAGKGFIEFDGKIFSVLFYAFLSLAIIQLIILSKWNSKVEHKRTEILPENKKSLFMIKYALAGAIAIYGLTLFLMNGNSNHLILFSGLAVAGMLLSYPKK
ncbi:MAG: hypothetical protein U9N04_00205 [Patescibacteria group bacterium]|nr:hypothetical protein [Patescibacteria group bacterium]